MPRMGKSMNRILEFFIGGALLIVGVPVILVLVNTTGLDVISATIVGKLFPLLFGFGGLYLMWDAISG